MRYAVKIIPPPLVSKFKESNFEIYDKTTGAVVWRGWGFKTDEYLDKAIAIALRELNGQPQELPDHPEIRYECAQLLMNFMARRKLMRAA